MAVTLTGATGLFTQLGKIFYAQEVLNTARGTTVETAVVSAITQFKELSSSIDVQAIIENLTVSFNSWKDGNTLAQELSSMGSRLIVQMVNADNKQPDESLRTALVELYSQMEGSGGETNPDNDVDASAASLSVSADAGNNTDGVIVASVINGDGRNVELALAEDIEGVVSSVSGNGSVLLSGEEPEGNRLNADWPRGSGLSTSLSGVTASGSLLKNGGMDDEDDRADTPDDWEVAVGTIGTTLLMSNYEEQTVTISGTPTSGTYVLVYTDVDSEVQRTAPIAYNATSSAVQVALRKLDGLSGVTVSSTGTSPNFAHTIVFEKMSPPGDIGNLSSTETFDVGSIAHAQTVAGTAHVYKDKAVIFDSNGSELTQIRQRLTSLQPRTVYCFNAWMKVDAYPAAGAVTVDLVDGSGTVIADVQGTDNTLAIDPQSGGDLSTSEFTAVNEFFRTPAVLPDLIYLRIRISTAISNTASLYIDEVSFVQPTELYSGGPFAVLFAGTTPLGGDDQWTIVVSNSRAGEFQDWFFRNWGNADLLIPSNTAGAETIDDALIV